MYKRLFLLCHYWPIFRGKATLHRHSKRRLDHLRLQTRSWWENLDRKFYIQFIFYFISNLFRIFSKKNIIITSTCIQNKSQLMILFRCSLTIGDLFVETARWWLNLSKTKINKKRCEWVSGGGFDSMVGSYSANVHLYDVNKSPFLLLILHWNQLHI